MTPNPTASVNPSDASLDVLRRWPDKAPIAMVNLLRFAPDGGRDSYRRYTRVASGTVAARGGSVIIAGPVIDSAEWWDSVVLVHYPRRAAYLDMQVDPAYRAAIADRTAGLDARLLYPFALAEDRTGPVVGSSDEVFALSLIRSDDSVPGPFGRPDGSGLAGRIELALDAGGPGLVTDGPWNQLLLVRYGSPAVAGSAVGDDLRHLAPGATEVMTMLVRSAA